MKKTFIVSADRHVTHKGVGYEAGSEISGLSIAEADELLACGAIVEQGPTAEEIEAERKAAEEAARKAAEEAEAKAKAEAEEAERAKKEADEAAAKAAKEAEEAEAAKKAAEDAAAAAGGNQAPAQATATGKKGGK